MGYTCYSTYSTSIQHTWNMVLQDSLTEMLILQSPHSIEKELDNQSEMMSVRFVIKDTLQSAGSH